MKWEYLVVSTVAEDEPLQSLLNSCGARGWELVSATPRPKGQWLVMVFKRPSQSVA